MGARIVVAEDDPSIRRLVAVTLRRAGHEVRDAADGETALLLVQADNPDLILLDVMLPGLDGLELARYFGADPATAQIPIIFLSARGQASEVATGLATGARRYLVKPFAPADLVACISAILATASPA